MFVCVRVSSLEGADFLGVGVGESASVIECECLCGEGGRGAQLSLACLFFASIRPAVHC